MRWHTSTDTRYSCQTIFLALYPILTDFYSESKWYANLYSANKLVQFSFIALHNLHKDEYKIRAFSLIKSKRIMHYICTFSFPVSHPLLLRVVVGLMFRSIPLARRERHYFYTSTSWVEHSIPRPPCRAHFCSSETATIAAKGDLGSLSYSVCNDHDDVANISNGRHQSNVSTVSSCVFGWV